MIASLGSSAGECHRGSGPTRLGERALGVSRPPAPATRTTHPREAHLSHSLAVRAGEHSGPTHPGSLPERLSEHYGPGRLLWPALRYGVCSPPDAGLSTARRLLTLLLTTALDGRGSTWTARPSGSSSADVCGWLWTLLILLRIRRQWHRELMAGATVSRPADRGFGGSWAAAERVITICASSRSARRRQQRTTQRPPSPLGS